jgi:hypothetical protein
MPSREQLKTGCSSHILLQASQQGTKKGGEEGGKEGGRRRGSSEEQACQ